jgi:glycosyltransferase involved in cell wall biosynthesis/ribosomal protein S18 acetylase RimI-like enzyme
VAIRMIAMVHDQRALGKVAHLATTDMTVKHLLLPQLVHLRGEGWDVSAISAEGPWVKQIEAAGIRHVAWASATRRWDPAADVRAFAELIAILRRERFDVLHCHNPKPGFLGRLAGRIVGVPTIINTVHGFWATPEDRARRRWPVMGAEWLAGRWSRLELYQSQEDLAWAERTGIAVPGRSRLLGNGVDLRLFDPRASRPHREQVRRDLGIPLDAVVVGTVGRIVIEKGYRELLAAADRIRAKHPDVWFLLVGEPDRDKDDLLAPAELERLDRVVVTGWREDVPRLMGAMDVFVLASWREGLPRSAIEAAATGLPMVLTDIRGCREVAGEGAAMLVPVRNVDALVDAVEDLIEDPARRAELGERAWWRARTMFDERTVLERIGRSTRALASPGTGAVPIVRARLADVEGISRLHTIAMPTAFLPTLGQGFLRRFHRSLVTDREATVVVARDQHGAVVGFAAGVPSTRRFSHRFLVRHGVGATVSIARSPRALRRLLETRSYASSRPSRSAGDAELIAVAVAERYRGQGLGRALTASVVEALATGGAPMVRVLVGAENAAAVGLYASEGFAPHHSIEVHEGQRSLVMTRCSSG